jgi:uncharacterized protein (TIGR02147 family)
MTRDYLQQITKEVSPTSFMSGKEYLLAVFQWLKTNVPKYTYERFSDDLGFGTTNIGYLLAHGKRPLTERSAQSIIKALHLKLLDRRYFLQLVAAQKKAAAPDPSEAYEKLVDLKSQALPKSIDRRFLEFYNQWYNIAILSLLDLPEALDTPEWISANLRPSVSPLKVQKSLDLLQKLGYVEYDTDKKRLIPSQKVLNTGPEVLGLAIVRYHQQMISLSLDAVTKIAPEDREITTITISVPAGAIQDLKERVRAFQADLMNYSQAHQHSDSVAQINIQVFPLTQTIGGKS